jgi:hypothetical protein
MQGETNFSAVVESESKHVRYAALATLLVLIFVVVARDELTNAQVNMTQAKHDYQEVQRQLNSIQDTVGKASKRLSQLNDEIQTTQEEKSSLQSELAAFEAEAKQDAKSPQILLAQLVMEKRRWETRRNSAEKALSWGQNYLQRLDELRRTHVEGAEQWYEDQRHANELEDKRLQQYTDALADVEERLRTAQGTGSDRGEQPAARNDPINTVEIGARQDHTHKLRILIEKKNSEIDSKQKQVQGLQSQLIDKAGERDRAAKEGEKHASQLLEAQKQLNAAKITVDQLQIRSIHFFQLGPVMVALAYCYFVIHLAALRKKLKRLKAPLGDVYIHASLASLANSDERGIRAAATLGLLGFEVLVGLVAQSWLLYQLYEIHYELRAAWALHVLGSALSVAAITFSFVEWRKYRCA